MHETAGNSGPRRQKEAAAPASAVLAASAGVAGGAIAVGAAGLMGRPLEIALTSLALVVAVAAVRVQRRQILLLVLAATVLLGLPVVATTGPAHAVLAVAAILAILASGQKDPTRKLLLTATLAVVALGTYRLACSCIPAVWALADASGWSLGRLAGIITGRPLWIGGTFGGIDLMVLMVTVYVAWICFSSSPRLPRAVIAAVAILAGHLAYLIVLSYSNDLAQIVPPAPPPPEPGPNPHGSPPDWSWAESVRALLPWNLPALAVAIHVGIAAVLFRTARWRFTEQGDDAAAAELSAGREKTITCVAAILAVVAPIALVLSWVEPDLSGKRIVLFDRGYFDLAKPEHGDYGEQSAGSFGAFPALVASLGGEFARASELTQEELDQADILVMLHPIDTFTDEQRDWIWKYVRNGGSLLVVAGPTVFDGDARSEFNDLLTPTGLEVRQDVAIEETVAWREALEAAPHGATPDVDASLRGLRIVGASSIRTSWPARPMLIGRFGYGDPGTDAVLTRRFQFDTGEKLGDLVLAAEQHMGRGTVVVLGSAVPLTNDGTIRSYRFNGRLLGYLANESGNPQTPWRQALGLLALVALLAALAWRAAPARLAAAAMLLVVSAAVSATASLYATQVLPSGPTPTDEATASRAPIAYIDASHMAAYSDDDWAGDGIAGLSMALMRDGYLPLMLPRLTAQQLDGAAMLISVAPARRFSASERKVVRDFVDRGGIFICTTGAQHAAASESLLAEFKINVPFPPVGPGDSRKEREPLGYLRQPYLTLHHEGGGDYQAFVHFYEGWPVFSEAEDAVALVGSKEDVPEESFPTVVLRDVGEGKVVVIGDSSFAMNKNLVQVEGDDLGWVRVENAHFWRWLISRITPGEQWTPPEVQAEEVADQDEEVGDADEAEEGEDAEQTDKADEAGEGTP